jgi:predicted RNase H-like nuclease (RuvC/YqgF family)
MTIPKGGRGKKAPYETTQMRVPVPIKEQVNSLIAKFRGEVLDDNNLLEPVNNSHLSLELESLQSEIQKLKTALEISEIEKLKLNTALEENNQQVEKLNTALINAKSEILNLSTSLEEEKKKSINLNTGKPITDIEINSESVEGEIIKHYNLERRVLRNPREKGETKVNFQNSDRIVFLEYIGQPKGKGTHHYWKITKIEYAPQNLSLAF